MEPNNDGKEYGGSWITSERTTAFGKAYMVGMEYYFGSKIDCVLFICGGDDVGIGALKIIYC